MLAQQKEFGLGDMVETFENIKQLTIKESLYGSSWIHCMTTKYRCMKMLNVLAMCYLYMLAT